MYGVNKKLMVITGFLLGYFWMVCSRNRRGLPSVPLVVLTFCLNLLTHGIIDIAEKLNLIPPIAEQCQHKCVIPLLLFLAWLELFLLACSIANAPRRNMRKVFSPRRNIADFIVSCRPLYAKYGIGTTVFSALAGGILTGKVIFK